MNEIDAIDLIQSAIWTVIVVSAPCVLAAMIVGTAIAVLQALTQIQEPTLTFVPKIIAVFLAAMLSAFYMGSTMFSFASLAYSRVASGF